jgi:hypothetical protein
MTSHDLRVRLRPSVSPLRSWDNAVTFTDGAPLRRGYSDYRRLRFTDPDQRGATKEASSIASFPSGAFTARNRQPVRTPKSWESKDLNENDFHYHLDEGVVGGR